MRYNTTVKYLRVIFVDFSSDFNLLKTRSLSESTIDLGVNGDFILWMKDFLPRRPLALVLKLFYD